MKGLTTLFIVCLMVFMAYSSPSKAQNAVIPATETQAPGYYRIKLGSYEITVLGNILPMK